MSEVIEKKKKGLDFFPFRKEFEEVTFSETSEVREKKEKGLDFFR